MARLAAAALVLILCLTSSAAIAGRSRLSTNSAASIAPLTANEVAQFVASLDDVRPLGEALLGAGKASALALDRLPSRWRSYTVYGDAVAKLHRKFPADYNSLAGLVAPRGYSPESWARTGDRVLVAYLAGKLEAQNPGILDRIKQQYAAMNPNAQALMPAVQNDLETASERLVTTFGAEPAGDVDAVAPYSDVFAAKFTGTIFEVAP